MAVSLRFLYRRRFLLAGAGFCASVLTGCGTVLHPERCGQPAGSLDWKIVGLNALGLILFFIPGVIAFAVDFYTGAIYLPPCEMGLSSQSDQPLVVRHVPREEMSRSQIETVVSSHAGQPIALAESNFSSQPLNSIDDFWQKVHDLTDHQPVGQSSVSG